MNTIIKVSYAIRASKEFLCDLFSNMRMEKKEVDVFFYIGLRSFRLKQLIGAKDPIYMITSSQ